MANEPAQARLFRAIFSLAYLVPFRHTTTCCSRALTLSAAIHFAMERSTPCSTVFRYSSSSWAVVVYWSALIPKAPTSSRNHPIQFYSWPPTQPTPPNSCSNITLFGNLLSSMGATNAANRIRLLRLMASMLSLPVFMTVSRLEIELSV